MRRGMGKSTQGKLFEQMTRNALTAIREQNSGNFWFQRIWDYKTYVAINPNLFCFKQVGDFMACNKGQFYIIECKSSVRERYAFKNVKEHQESAMRVIEKAGGIYWLLILHRSTEDRKHQLFALRPENWFKVKNESAGYESATWESIEKHANLRIQRNGGVWDLRELFSNSPLRFRKLTRAVRLTKRDISFILSKDFPAVALYDPETDEINIITDIWTKQCWKKWGINFEKFIDFLVFDLNISIVHELMHWATEPIELEGAALTNWEVKVERVARELVTFSPRMSVCVIEHPGIEDDEDNDLETNFWR
jgi:penicillin-binding protein-related factor A (putative recombinase)